MAGCMYTYFHNLIELNVVCSSLVYSSKDLRWLVECRCSGLSRVPVLLNLYQVFVIYMYMYCTGHILDNLLVPTQLARLCLLSCQYDVCIWSGLAFLVTLRMSGCVVPFYLILHGPPAVVKYHFTIETCCTLIILLTQFITPLDVHVVVVVEGQALVDVVMHTSRFTTEEGSDQLRIMVL